MELFYQVDPVGQVVVPQWDHYLRVHVDRTRYRAGQLALSEVMTIVIHIHHVRLRDFKTYYLVYVLGHVHREFPGAVSCQRLVELMPSTVGPLCADMLTYLGPCTGLSCVDSTALAVCHNRRIRQHRVFRGLAQRGKASLGWLYGFKLHVVINYRDELLACQLAPGNVNDRRPVLKRTERLCDRLCRGKGYLSASLTRELRQSRRVRSVIHRKRNMAHRLLLLPDKVLLRRRALRETVFDQFKHLLQVEHTRHRSLTNFAVNLVARLIADCHQPNKLFIDRNGRPHLSMAIPN